MDPLSDVLSLLKTRSLLSSRFEGRGRWRMSFGAYDAQIKFGSVLAGTLYLAMEGARRVVRLETGDFYLLTNGRPFSAASDPDARALDGTRLYRKRLGTDGIVRIGEQGELVSLASGRLNFEGDAAALLLGHLPPLIHLRGSAPGSASLAALLTLLRDETGSAGPGSAVARSSLASLILVQALRVFLAEAAQPAGWLRALTDRRIGASLAAMHANVARPWTLPELAAVAGMSRSAFAQRFGELAGATPHDYLQGWRLALARRALTDGEEPLARIAARVGYQSDTAFSAAFKRVVGESPGRFRTRVRAAAPRDADAANDLVSP